MTIRRRRLATVAVAAWIWPHALAAQVPAAQGPAPIQIGPLGLFPTVVIADVGTDSNVFDETTDPKDDFTFTVGPRLIAALGRGSTRLTTSSSWGFVYFEKYKDQESVNLQHGVRLDLTMSRFRPSASAQYTRTRERPNLEIDARARRTEYTLATGLDLELTGITALTVSVRTDGTTYAQGEQFRQVNLADELNRTGKSASGGLKVFLTPFTTLVLAAEVEQDRFSGTHLRDADSFGFAPALEFSSEAAVSGRAAAGYRRFQPLDPSVPAYRGLVASVGVTYKLLDVTTFDVQANRDVTYSFEETEPYYLSTGGRVLITQRLFGPVDIVVSGQREQLAYRSLETAGPVERTDTVNVVSGGFGLRVSRNIRVTLTGERTERRSTSPGQQEYQRTRVLGSVTLGS
jgi:hypothetical protein